MNYRVFLFSCTFFILSGIFANDTHDPLLPQHQWNNDWIEDLIQNDGDFTHISQNENLAVLLKDLSQQIDAVDSRKNLTVRKKKHDLIIEQTQDGTYNYSYGDNGTLRSIFYERYHTDGNKGHYTSRYYQENEGQTNQSESYVSGFITVGTHHYNTDGMATKAHGRELSLYFNKNPNGTYDVYAKSIADLRSISVPAGKMATAIHVVADTVMNATSYDAIAFSDASFILDSSKKHQVQSGNLAIFMEAETPQGKDLTEIRSSITSVFPKARGDFHKSVNSTVAGSHQNFSFVESISGYQWVGEKPFGIDSVTSLINVQSYLKYTNTLLNQ